MRWATSVLVAVTLGLAPGACGEQAESAVESACAWSEPPAAQSAPPRVGATPSHAQPASPGETTSADQVAEAAALAGSAANERASAAASGSDPAAPLRYATHRLSDLLLRSDQVSPPLSGRPPTTCMRGIHNKPFANRYSKLEGPARAHHLRVTQSGGSHRRVDFRDSLLFSLDRTFTFELTVPAEARLEFGYRLFRCRARLADAFATVTVTDLDADGAETRQQVPLYAEVPEGEPRWQDAVVALDAAPGRRVRLTVAFTGQAAGGALAWSEPVITGRAQPAVAANDLNVLMIVIDSLRGDVVGPGSAIKSITPNLDALFASGTSFKRAFSMSNQTRPSMIGMLSSQMPSMGKYHSAAWVLRALGKNGFYGGDPPLITRRLGESGWRVWHIGNNPFLWDSNPIGMDHGFDRAIDFRVHDSDTIAITDESVRFIENHGDERFFLLVNYLAPHTPYKPPEQYVQRVKDIVGERPPRSLSLKYLGEVAWVDDNIPPLLEALERSGARDRTLIIVTSDHGEVMHRQHACFSERFKQPCHFSHGLTLYDEEIHVPMAFILPGRVAAGQVLDAETSHIDLAPTLLDMLGLPPERRQAGRSLAAALAGGSHEPSAVYVEGRVAVALRQNDMKLILHNARDDAFTRARTGGADLRPRKQLFDLVADPQELDNLALKRDPRVEQLKAALTRVRAGLALATAGQATNLARSDATARDGSARPDPPAQPAAGLAAVVPMDAGVMKDTSRAQNGLRLMPGPGPHTLTGTVATAEGRLECGKTQGAAACFERNARELVLRLESGEAGAAVSFVSQPWAAPLDFDVLLDGHHHPTDEFRLGPFGVALLSPGEGLNTPRRLKLAAGVYPPKVKAGTSGVFYWRNPSPVGAAPGIAALAGPESMPIDNEADTEMEEEVRKMLKELGYTQ